MGKMAYAKDDVYQAIEDLRRDIRGLHVKLDRALGMIPDEPLRRSFEELKQYEARIVRAVAEYYDMVPAALMQETNSWEVARPRHLAMYLLRELLGYSYPQCARVLGHFHHTTVMHGIKVIRDRRIREPQFNDAVAKLVTSLSKRLPVTPRAFCA